MGLVWLSVKHRGSPGHLFMFLPTLHIHEFTSSYCTCCQDAHHQEDTDSSSALLTAVSTGLRHLRRNKQASCQADCTGPTLLPGHKRPHTERLSDPRTPQAARHGEMALKVCSAAVPEQGRAAQVLGVRKGGSQPAGVARLTQLRV